MKGKLFALLLAVATPALAAPADEWKRLTDDYWAWTLRENPTLASTLGAGDHDRRLADVNVAAMDRRAAERKAFLARLDAIPASALNASEGVDRAILRRALSDDIADDGFGQRLMLFTNRSGWHQTLPSLADSLPFRRRVDYENFLARLEAYPALNDAALKVTAQAVAGGFTQPCEAMEGFETSIAGVIGADPTASRIYGPFKRVRPADASVAEWEGLQARARAVIAGPVKTAYAKHLEFHTKRYRCNPSISAAAQPDGARYYAHRIRSFTTTDRTADDIHALGLSEVARIRAEMEAVAKKAGFATREAFIADLRTNTRYYAKTPEELMEATARETKRIDGLMPTLFGVLPRLPYGIREIPAETAEGTTTAYYTLGSPETGVAGTYYVNTSKLDQRPLWEIPALSVHEAVPGHHHQIALQQELPLPTWRRHGVSFTAFTEGWGLYSERLGIEMGLYDTPAKDMGRLSYEMWRACRLVVDTGIHAKGWSKDRAIAFMTDNSALSVANIEAEVNRYIAWPGQALAYKIGELKIRELRAKAERTLGATFDLRAFHDAVLAQGAVPLDVLEAQIDAWIATRQRAGR